MLRRNFVWVLSAVGLLPLSVKVKKKELVGCYCDTGHTIRWFRLQGEVADMLAFHVTHAAYYRGTLLMDNPRLELPPIPAIGPKDGSLLGLGFAANTRRDCRAVRFAIERTGCQVVEYLD